MIPPSGPGQRDSALRLTGFRALKSPGWRPEWHVGVRASKSQKLVAFISGVPVELRVRSKVLHCSEINFLCIHKKLRDKRLAPVLIKEITRRCYVLKVFQAIYTGGIVLPKPVSTCRYFHRSLDWLKLYEVGFSSLPPKSTKARQITKFHLPSNTSTPGLRPMQSKDVSSVQDLLQRYLKRFDMAPEFTTEEIDHWLLHKDKSAEQVIWTYVVEEPETHKISDFISFYCLESSVIGNRKHDTVRAAYLYYYATVKAFMKEESGLKGRLNELVNDALILAKRVRPNPMASSPLMSYLQANNLSSTISMSSMLSHFLTTLSSSNRRSLDPETVSCISICTTIERVQLLVELI